MDNFENEFLKGLATMVRHICDSSIAIISVYGRCQYSINPDFSISEESLVALLSRLDHDRDFITHTNEKLIVSLEDQVRFVAGFPLENSENLCIGKIIVLNSSPKKLIRRHIKAIKNMADFAVLFAENMRSQALLYQSLELHVPMRSFVDYELLKPANALIELSRNPQYKKNVRSKPDYFNRSLDKLLGSVAKLRNRKQVELPGRKQKLRLH